MYINYTIVYVVLLPELEFPAHLAPYIDWNSANKSVSPRAILIESSKEAAQ